MVSLSARVTSVRYSIFTFQPSCWNHKNHWKSPKKTKKLHSFFGKSALCEKCRFARRGVLKQKKCFQINFSVFSMIVSHFRNFTCKVQGIMQKLLADTMKMDKNCRVSYNNYWQIWWRIDKKEKQGYLPINNSYIGR